MYNSRLIINSLGNLINFGLIHTITNFLLILEAQSLYNYLNKILDTLSVYLSVLLFPFYRWVLKIGAKLIFLYMKLFLIYSQRASDLSLLFLPKMLIP